MAAFAEREIKRVETAGREIESWGMPRVVW